METESKTATKSHRDSDREAEQAGNKTKQNEFVHGASSVRKECVIVQDPREPDF